MDAKWIDGFVFKEKAQKPHSTRHSRGLTVSVNNQTFCG